MHAAPNPIHFAIAHESLVGKPHSSAAPLQPIRGSFPPLMMMMMISPQSRTPKQKSPLPKIEERHYWSFWRWIEQKDRR